MTTSLALGTRSFAALVDVTGAGWHLFFGAHFLLLRIRGSKPLKCRVCLMHFILSELLLVVALQGEYQVLCRSTTSTEIDFMASSLMERVNQHAGDESMPNHPGARIGSQSSNSDGSLRPVFSGGTRIALPGKVVRELFARIEH